MKFVLLIGLLTLSFLSGIPGAPTISVLVVILFELTHIRIVLERNAKTDEDPA